MAEKPKRPSKIAHGLLLIDKPKGYSSFDVIRDLRRATGDRGHEKGVTVSLSHLKGSQGIAQLSDCVIALERDQQAKDPVEANTTKVRVLKSRYTGDTGLACALQYNTETGRLFEVDSEDTFDNEELDF